MQADVLWLVKQKRVGYAAPMIIKSRYKIIKIRNINVWEKRIRMNL